MSDPPKKKPFDISLALAPVSVQTPDLGTLAIDIRTTSFLSWIDFGAKAGHWPDGWAFIRHFLKDRTVRQNSDNLSDYSTPTPANLVDDLDQAALERTAAAIIEVATPYLTILNSNDEDAQPGEVTPRTGSDDVAEPEQATSALLAMALEYLAADRRRSRALAALLIGDHDRLARTIGFAASQSDILGQFGTLSSFLGSRADLRRMSELAQSPAARMARELASSGIMAQAAAASKLALGVDRQLFGITQGLALQPWLARNSVLALAQDARLGWVRELNQTLGLGIRSGIADAIGRLAVDPKLVTGAAFAAAAMMRPGYQTVGTLALAGSVARGLAADVLRSYDLASADGGELFASAVSCVALLDDDEASPADRANALHVFMDLMGGFAGYLGDQVQQAGLIAILSLLISIAASYPDFRALLNPSEPKPPAEMVETNARLKALAEQMKNDRDRVATEQSRIRYVHSPSPLRVGPDRSAMRMRTVFPDQLVEVRDANGSWAKVAVFDYRSNQEAIGWMSRHNLHVLPQ